MWGGTSPGQGPFDEVPQISSAGSLNKGWFDKKDIGLMQNEANNRNPGLAGS